jgi:hypothetical protein
MRFFFPKFCRHEGNRTLFILSEATVTRWYTSRYAPCRYILKPSGWYGIRIRNLSRDRGTSYTNMLTIHFFAVPTGFEPVIFGLTIRHLHPADPETK